jgi:hypothetical protein
MPNLTFTTTFRIGLVCRFVDNSNYYDVPIQITTTGGVTLYVYKRVGGTQTQLGTLAIPTTFVANELWGMKIRITGSSLKAKAWKLADTTGLSEPDWQVSVTDTDLTTGSNVGFHARNNGASTTAQAYFTNFVMRSPQALTAVRSTTHNVAHAAADVVEPTYPAHVVL